MLLLTAFAAANARTTVSVAPATEEADPAAAMNGASVRAAVDLETAAARSKMAVLSAADAFAVPENTHSICGPVGNEAVELELHAAATLSRIDVASCAPAPADAAGAEAKRIDVERLAVLLDPATAPDVNCTAEPTRDAVQELPEVAAALKSALVVRAAAALELAEGEARKPAGV